MCLHENNRHWLEKRFHSCSTYQNPLAETILLTPVFTAEYLTKSPPLQNRSIRDLSIGYWNTKTKPKKLKNKQQVCAPRFCTLLCKSWRPQRLSRCSFRGRRPDWNVQQLRRSICLEGEAYSLGPARLMIYDFQDEFFYSCQQMMLLHIFLVTLDLSPSQRPLGLSARRPILD